jgi:hypothetical protein
MQESAKSQVDHVVLTGGTVTFAPAKKEKAEAKGRTPFMQKVYQIKAEEGLTLTEAVKAARARFPQLHKELLNQS